MTRNKQPLTLLDDLMSSVFRKKKMPFYGLFKGKVLLSTIRSSSKARQTRSLLFGEMCFLR
jgi:hypothetical protein